MTQLRKTVFANDEIYHIFNRTNGNQEVFVDARDIKRALDLINYYRFAQRLRFSLFKNLSLEAKEEYEKEYKITKPNVEIYTFAFMPNHFHFLLKQITENGIKSFASNFQNAYAKYYNKKHDRDGSVFKRLFKSKWVENDEIFLHLSRYIHLNPVTSFQINISALSNLQTTSYPMYLKEFSNNTVNSSEILKIVGSNSLYKKFVENQVDYQRRLSLIRHLALE